MYDDIPFDEERNIILLEDVGLVGMYIEDCKCLAEIAGILGHTDKEQALKARTEEMEERMEQLWDEDFGMYLNRREDTGEFEYRLSPFHFHALFSSKVGEKTGAPDDRRTLLQRKGIFRGIHPSLHRAQRPGFPGTDLLAGDASGRR